MRQKLYQWGRAPLVIGRSVLTAKYVMFVILGALGLYAGNVSLDQVGFAGFTPVWAWGLVISGAVSAFASIDEAHEPLEKWAGLLLTGWMASWSFGALIRVIATGDGSLTGSFALFMLTLVPAARVLRLFRRSGLPGEPLPVIVIPEEKK